MEGIRQGSFGIPDQMKREIERTRSKKDRLDEQPGAPSTKPFPAPEPAVAAPSAETTPEPTPANSAEATSGARKQLSVEEFDRYVSEYEKILGVKITEEDTVDYIFRGRIQKRGVIIVPGKLQATLRTLTAKEVNEVNAQIEAWTRENDVRDPKRAANERNLRILSLAVIEVSGRELGKDSAERYARLSNFGTHVLQRLIDAWNTFDVLIEFMLEQDRYIKKS